MPKAYVPVNGAHVEPLDITLTEKVEDSAVVVVERKGSFPERDARTSDGSGTVKQNSSTTSSGSESGVAYYGGPIRHLTDCNGKNIIHGHVFPSDAISHAMVYSVDECSITLQYVKHSQAFPRNSFS
jgi:hypothetical protein